MRSSLDKGGPITNPTNIRGKENPDMARQLRIPFTQVQIGRFLFLLISIVLMFVLRPFFGDLVGMSLLMNIFLSVILISGIYAVSQKKGVFIVALVIALLTLVAQWSTYFVKTLSFPVVGNALGALFLAYTATIILAHLFAEDEITSDVIMGAICVYFLIGLIWAFVFSTLEILQPGSFQMPQGTGTELSNFSYYSYVTLTTLGYGDITPISAPARSFALLEAIMGQLYIAILIARLVGIHISQSMFRQQPDKD